MKFTQIWFTSILLVMTLVVASCGKNNESGKSSGKYYGSSYSGVGPANTSNPYVQQVFQQMPCSTGSYGNGNANQRIGTGTQMNFRVAANSTYVGVTPEGDIAVLTGDNVGNAVMSLYICPRPMGGQGSASMPHNPVFNRALPQTGCRIDEITSATALVPSAMGQPYVLAFAPIYFYQQLRSSLCSF
jgi:hypothetical protein